VQPALLAHEELRAERGLEMLDAGGHVRLHAMQLAGGRADAALVRHRLEDLQGSEVHYSRSENDPFTIIHLPG
jgi:hypothetical protein